jgi:IS5 family transposase
MITDFADFCLWMYAVIDDLWPQLSPTGRRPGPAPGCSDSELLTMALVGECMGWDQDTMLIYQWQQHRDLFPCQPSRTRFVRRREQLTLALNALRRLVLRLLDVAQERQCVIDSLPLPVVQFHLVPGCSREWACHGASFGKVPTKKQTIFGYKLHLLVTLGGVILDFELAPANVSDLRVGAELLEQWCDLRVLGDKAYISAPVAQALREQRRVALITLPRKNQKRSVSERFRRLHNSARAIVETVNAQLGEQFHLESNHAHSFAGLCTRLYTKLTAHTLCLYLQRLLGNPDFLQIKALAFPN